MNRFQELFFGDMKRYHQRKDRYVSRLLRCFRRAQCCKNGILRKWYRLEFGLLKRKRGIELSYATQIGKGLYLGHAYNITVNPAAVIGENCNIHRGVLIGQENRGKRKGVPTIGNEVWIGINAAIVGKITVGDDVLIAPNSFVNCDVPSHSVVYGNPCVIKPREHATEGYINHKA